MPLSSVDLPASSYENPWGMYPREDQSIGSDTDIFPSLSPEANPRGRPARKPNLSDV